MNCKLLKDIILMMIGYCLYIAIEVTYRGYSYVLMGVVASVTIFLLDKINDKISWDFDLLAQMGIGSALITGFEFIIGNLSLYGFLPVMWDYSNLPLNYKGIICLPFSLLWMVLSCVAIFVADAINYYVYEELPVPYYKIFGKEVIRFKEKHCKL